jgi:hypothetical protein
MFPNSKWLKILQGYNQTWTLDLQLKITHPKNYGIKVFNRLSTAVLAICSSSTDPS